MKKSLYFALLNFEDLSHVKDLSDNREESDNRKQCITLKKENKKNI